MTRDKLIIFGKLSLMPAEDESLPPETDPPEDPSNEKDEGQDLKNLTTASLVGETTDADGIGNSDGAGKSDGDDIVTAEFADGLDGSDPFALDGADATAAGAIAAGQQQSNLPKNWLDDNTTPNSVLVEDIAAKGGAVGSLVLGLFTFFGSFITSYSIINGVLGLLLGLWGLRSRKPRLAIIGLVLSMVGMILSAVQITELIQWWLEVRAANAEPDF